MSDWYDAADEPRTLVSMEAFMCENGLVHAGLHHEIHLTDPRVQDPAEIRTILRRPVRTAWNTIARTRRFAREVHPPTGR